ncbi:MAG: c-type cytochrome [Noviherbaspirillum sp.]
MTVRDTAPPLPAAAALLFGAVARPPHIAWDTMPPQSARLLHLDAAQVRAMPDVVDVVVRGNFVGVVARSAQAAEMGVAGLRLRWSGPERGTTAAASLVGTTVLAERGNPDAAPGHDIAVEATYRWPLAPSAGAAAWAVAQFRDGALMVWAPMDAAPGLRAELAALVGIGVDRVGLACIPGSACAEARHAAADAALLSQAVGQAVHVTLAPAQVRIGDGYALASQVTASLGPDGRVAAYRMVTGATPPSAPPLALLLAAVSAPLPQISSAAPGALPPYAYPVLRISAAAAAGMAPVAYPEQGVTAAYVFAHESHLDALAAAAGVDPVKMRLAEIEDARGSALVRRVAERAGWTARSGPRAGSGVARGQGFAYASVVDIDEDNQRSHAAWVVDVEVDMSSGDVTVARVVVGHEAGERAVSIHPPQAPDCLLEGAAMAEASRLTADAPAFDAWDLTAVSGLPSHPCSPAGQPPAAPVLRAGGAAMLPAAAAVANAIYDATGVRMREPPFSPARVRQALAGRNSRPALRKRGLLASAAAAALAVLAAAYPWRAPIAPVAAPPAGFYSAQTLERGRLVAAAGDCVVCHTAPNGQANAGGLALDTPFGTIYSTNITPDPQTGIGAWSYPAFERAMREGVHRDGRRLYPAFPYTAFAKVSEGDMQSLYAWLMSQPAVPARPPETRLAFPFNLRPLMAGWNLLFHRNEPFRPDPSRSLEWNRGAYLAEGLGHCSACHTPRNAFGAEKGGKSYLGGGEAESWDAPPLTALSSAPLPWTRDELYRYLRDGYAPLHGPAAGPMAPVVEGLAELPDSDVMAIATYVASYGSAASPATLAAQAEALQQRSQAAAARLTGAGADLFAGACAVCHQAGQGTAIFGEKVPLTFNTNLHAPRPDNLVQVLMHGVTTSASSRIGAMPGFADSLSDRQMTTLVDYLRQLYAPDKAPWTNVGETVARIRADGH